MWYKIDGSLVELRIFAKPNARRSEITGVNEHGLCIAVHARPQEGEANLELIAFLARQFRIPKSKIMLRRGEGSRHKVVTLPLSEELLAFIEAGLSS